MKNIRAPGTGMSGPPFMGGGMPVERLVCQFADDIGHVTVRGISKHVKKRFTVKNNNTYPPTDSAFRDFSGLLRFRYFSYLFI